MASAMLVLHSSKRHANHRLVAWMMVERRGSAKSGLAAALLASSARRVVSHRDTE